MKHQTWIAVTASLALAGLTQADAWTFNAGDMYYMSEYDFSSYEDMIYMPDYPNGYDTGNGSYDQLTPGMSMWAASSSSYWDEYDSDGNSQSEYFYEETQFWLNISTDIGLVISGYGDMGYSFVNAITGTQFSGMTENLNEFTLGAGTWYITFADMGYGQQNTTDDYWESEDGSEWYSYYSSNYNANGGMSIAVGIPGPGAIALLSIASLGRPGRRRRH